MDDEMMFHDAYDRSKQHQNRTEVWLELMWWCHLEIPGVFVSFGIRHLTKWGWVLLRFVINLARFSCFECSTSLLSKWQSLYLLFLQVQSVFGYPEESWHGLEWWAPLLCCFFTSTCSPRHIWIKNSMSHFWILRHRHWWFHMFLPSADE